MIDITTQKAAWDSALAAFEKAYPKRLATLGITTSQQDSVAGASPDQTEELIDFTQIETHIHSSLDNGEPFSKGQEPFAYAFLNVCAPDLRSAILLNNSSLQGCLNETQPQKQNNLAREDRETKHSGLHASVAPELAASQASFDCVVIAAARTPAAAALPTIFPSKFGLKPLLWMLDAILPEMKNPQQKQYYIEQLFDRMTAEKMTDLDVLTGVLAYQDQLPSELGFNLSEKLFSLIEQKDATDDLLWTQVSKVIFSATWQQLSAFFKALAPRESILLLDQLKRSATYENTKLHLADKIINKLLADQLSKVHTKKEADKLAEEKYEREVVPLVEEIETLKTKMQTENEAPSNATSADNPEMPKLEEELRQKGSALRELNEKEKQRVAALTEEDPALTAALKPFNAALALAARKDPIHQLRFVEAQVNPLTKKLKEAEDELAAKSKSAAQAAGRVHFEPADYSQHPSNYREWLKKRDAFLQDWQNKSTTLNRSELTADEASVAPAEGSPQETRKNLVTELLDLFDGASSVNTPDPLVFLQSQLAEQVLNLFRCIADPKNRDLIVDEIIQQERTRSKGNGKQEGDFFTTLFFLMPGDSEQWDVGSDQPQKPRLLALLKLLGSHEDSALLKTQLSIKEDPMLGPLDLGSMLISQTLFFIPEGEEKSQGFAYPLLAALPESERTKLLTKIIAVGGSETESFTKTLMVTPCGFLPRLWFAQAAPQGSAQEHLERLLSPESFVKLRSLDELTAVLSARETLVSKLSGDFRFFDHFFAGLSSEEEERFAKIIGTTAKESFLKVIFSANNESLFEFFKVLGVEGIKSVIRLTASQLDSGEAENSKLKKGIDQQVSNIKSDPAFKTANELTSALKKLNTTYESRKEELPKVASTMGDVAPTIPGIDDLIETLEAYSSFVSGKNSGYQITDDDLNEVFATHQNYHQKKAELQQHIEEQRLNWGIQGINVPEDITRITQALTLHSLLKTFQKEIPAEKEAAEAEKQALVDRAAEEAAAAEQKVEGCKERLQRMTVLVKILEACVAEEEKVAAAKAEEEAKAMQEELAATHTKIIALSPDKVDPETEPKAVIKNWLFSQGTHFSSIHDESALEKDLMPVVERLLKLHDSAHTARHSLWARIKAFLGIDRSKNFAKRIRAEVKTSEPLNLLKEIKAFSQNNPKSKIAMAMQWLQEANQFEQCFAASVSESAANQSGEASTQAPERAAENNDEAVIKKALVWGLKDSTVGSCVVLHEIETGCSKSFFSAKKLQAFFNTNPTSQFTGPRLDAVRSTLT